jgi:hypothetical protein
LGDWCQKNCFAQTFGFCINTKYSLFVVMTKNRIHWGLLKP